MSNFREAMYANPPRLVIQFRRGDNGTEQFQWGVVGNIPLISLIGAIGRVQLQIAAGEWMPESDGEPASFVLAWDAVNAEFSAWNSPAIPADPLLGMLEMVKAALVASRMGQRVAAEQVPPPILGPDGRPMRRL